MERRSFIGTLLAALFVRKLPAVEPVLDYNEMPLGGAVYRRGDAVGTVTEIDHVSNTMTVSY